MLTADITLNRHTERNKEAIRDKITETAQHQRNKSIYKTMLWIAVPSAEIKLKQTGNKFSSNKDTGNHLKPIFTRDVNKDDRLKEKE